MIDNFSLGLTHGLLLLVAWRLLFRTDINKESKDQPSTPAPAPEKQGWRKQVKRDA
jgi:hypothetical protein